MIYGDVASSFSLPGRYEANLGPARDHEVGDRLKGRHIYRLLSGIRAAGFELDIRGVRTERGCQDRLVLGVISSRT